MKLTAKERLAISLLRKLDTQQRDNALADIGRQVLANKITLRVGKLRRLKTAEDRVIEGAFGSVPKQPSRVRRPPRRGGEGQT